MEATGLSDRTIRNGIAEIKAGEVLPNGYQRKVGGGRKSLEHFQLDLIRTAAIPGVAKFRGFSHAFSDSIRKLSR